jgi:uncharacterized protein involved in exopolysaccharide biosynthesis
MRHDMPPPSSPAARRRLWIFAAGIVLGGAVTLGAELIWQHRTASGLGLLLAVVSGLLYWLERWRGAKASDSDDRS